MIPSGKNNRIYALVLILLNVIWGGTYIASKIPMEFEGLQPITLAFVRFSLTGLIMIPFLLTIYRGVKMSMPDHLICANLGFTGFTLAYIFQNIGVRHTKTMNAALEIASEPITMIILAAFILNERITKKMAAGIALSLGGVLLIVLPPELFKTAAESAASKYSIFGDAFVLLSTICCSLYTIWGRDIIKRVPSFVVTAYAVITGSILLYPFAAFYEGGLSKVAVLTPKSWACIFYLAAIATAFAYFAWYYLLERLNASYMGIFLNLQPLVGIILGYFILGEPLTPWTFGGGALIIWGVYLASQEEYKTHPELIVTRS